MFNSTLCDQELQERWQVILVAQIKITHGQRLSTKVTYPGLSRAVALIGCVNLYRDNDLSKALSPI